MAKSNPVATRVVHRPKSGQERALQALIEIGKARAALRAFALALPGAREEFPWGERVVKVNKKIFAFLGMREGGKELGLSVKLPASAKAALTYPFAAPTGYGLGKSGWVSVRIGQGEGLPTDLLLRWIEESYCAVAPKRLVRHRASPAATPARGRRPRR